MGRITHVIESIALMHYPGGKASRVRPTGNMVMWVAVLLALYMWLLLSFVD